jgi:hypothetical protein
MLEADVAIMCVVHSGQPVGKAYGVFVVVVAMEA